jgi:lipopolysaccharide biosynthesis protein
LLGLNLGLAEFPIESGQVDGTIAHAIERIFVLAVRKAGFEAAILPDMKHRSQPY